MFLKLYLFLIAISASPFFNLVKEEIQKIATKKHESYTFLNEFKDTKLVEIAFKFETSSMKYFSGNELEIFKFVVDQYKNSNDNHFLKESKIVYNGRNFDKSLIKNDEKLIEELEKRIKIDLQDKSFMNDFFANYNAIVVNINGPLLRKNPSFHNQIENDISNAFLNDLDYVVKQNEFGVIYEYKKVKISEYNKFIFDNYLRFKSGKFFDNEGLVNFVFFFSDDVFVNKHLVKFIIMQNLVEAKSNNKFVKYEVINLHFYDKMDCNEHAHLKKIEKIKDSKLVKNIQTDFFWNLSISKEYFTYKNMIVKAKRSTNVLRKNKLEENIASFERTIFGLEIQKQPFRSICLSSKNKYRSFSGNPTNNNSVNKCVVETGEISDLRKFRAEKSKDFIDRNNFLSSSCIALKEFNQNLILVKCENLEDDDLKQNLGLNIKMICHFELITFRVLTPYVLKTHGYSSFSLIVAYSKKQTKIIYLKSVFFPGEYNIENISKYLIDKNNSFNKKEYMFNSNTKNQSSCDLTNFFAYLYHFANLNEKIYLNFENPFDCIHKNKNEGELDYYKGFIHGYHIKMKNLIKGENYQFFCNFIHKIKQTLLNIKEVNINENDIETEYITYKKERTLEEEEYLRALDGHTFYNNYLTNVVPIKVTSGNSAKSKKKPCQDFCLTFKNYHIFIFSKLNSKMKILKTILKDQNIIKPLQAFYYDKIKEFKNDNNVMWFLEKNLSDIKSIFALIKKGIDENKTAFDDAVINRKVQDFIYYYCNIEEYLLLSLLKGRLLAMTGLLSQEFDFETKPSIKTIILEMCEALSEELSKLYHESKERETKLFYINIYILRKDGAEFPEIYSKLKEFCNKANY